MCVSHEVGNSERGRRRGLPDGECLIVIERNDNLSGHNLYAFDVRQRWFARLDLRSRRWQTELG